MAALAMENLTFCYPGAPAPALKGVNLSIPAGGFTVLMGPTGCGKTTLLHHMKPELAPAGRRTGTASYRGQPLWNGESGGRPGREKPGGAAAVGPRAVGPGAVGPGTIGLVAQDPAAQLTMDTVRRELVFGMENLQIPPGEMHRRLGELAGFFGMTGWLDRPLKELSGGQQQMVNLAAAMLLRPEILLLDEPTSQLDPVTAKEFLHLLARINDEFGTTIVISEHRLEEVLPLARTAVFLREGRVEYAGPVGPLCRRLWSRGGEARAWTPSLAKVALAAENGSPGRWEAAPRTVPAVPSDSSLPAFPGLSTPELPLTVREGRSWLEEHKSLFTPGGHAGARTGDRHGRGGPAAGHAGTRTGSGYGWGGPAGGRTGARTGGKQGRGGPAADAEGSRGIEGGAPPAVDVKDLAFQYTPSGPKVLDGAELEVPPNEVFAILGANGAGKSTLLKLMMGLLIPQSGRVHVGGKAVWRIKEGERFRLLGYLDQTPALYFAADTVGGALEERARRLGLDASAAVGDVTADLGLDAGCLGRHPYDLSGGELQLAALCLIMLADPPVLLLDEPTKGLDPASKERFGRLLQRLARRKSVIIASHDVEFTAAYAHSCALLFDGRVLEPSPVGRFFQENYFYTTPVSRVFRDTIPGAVTWRDVVVGV